MSTALPGTVFCDPGGTRPQWPDRYLPVSGGRSPSRAVGEGALWGGSKLSSVSSGGHGGEENVIFESNSILRFFQPNLYLSVFDPATKDFKASARGISGPGRTLSCSRTRLGEIRPGKAFRSSQLRAKPLFSIRRDCYVTPAIANFVEARLVAGEDQSSNIHRFGGFHR